MNRTQRAIKRSLRQKENSCSSFKRIYVSSMESFGPNTEGLKAEQKKLKEARANTREFQSRIRNKEVIEA